jgi:hypothetical protein
MRGKVTNDISEAGCGTVSYIELSEDRHKLMIT